MVQNKDFKNGFRPVTLSVPGRRYFHPAIFKLLSGHRKRNVSDLCLFATSNPPSVCTPHNHKSSPDPTFALSSQLPPELQLIWSSSILPPQTINPQRLVSTPTASASPYPGSHNMAEERNNIRRKGNEWALGLGWIFWKGTFLRIYSTLAGEAWHQSYK